MKQSDVSSTRNALRVVSAVLSMYWTHLDTH